MVEPRIQSIEYTDGPNLPPGNRRIVFSYESRDDTQFAYESGERRTVTKRLRAIEMFAPHSAGGSAQSLWKYDLKYIPSSQTERSLLDSVTWIDANGFRSKPTTFDWSHGDSEGSSQRFSGDFQVAWEGDDLTFVDNTAWVQVSLADLNGDGRDDLIYNDFGPHPGGEDWTRLTVRLSQGTFFGPPIQTLSGQIFSTLGDFIRRYPDITQPPPPDLVYVPHSAQFADFNNDGRMDMLVAGSYDHSNPALIAHAVLTWNDEQQKFVRMGGVMRAPSVPLFAPPRSMVVADLDGNGVLDLLQPRDPDPAPHAVLKWSVIPDLFGLPGCTNGNPDYCFKDPDAAAFDTGVFYDTLAGELPVDLDGDGATEFLTFGPGVSGQGAWKIWQDPTAGSVVDPDRFEQQLGELQDWSVLAGAFLDVNGDGLKDAIGGSDRLSVRINTGRGFLPEYVAYDGGSSPSSPTISAFQGKYDVVVMPGPQQFGVKTRIADFNHDGYDDILVLDAPGPSDILAVPRVGPADETSFGALINARHSGPQLLYSDGRNFHHVQLPARKPRAFHQLDPSTPCGNCNPQFVTGSFWSGTTIGDVDGDGLPDIVSLVTDGTITTPKFHFELWSSSKKLSEGQQTFGTQQDVITSVRTLLPEELPHSGLLDDEVINYATIGTYLTGSRDFGGRVYESDLGCRYPQRCLTRGMDVVRSYKPNYKDQPFTYFYRDGRFDSRGRGFLGFSEVRSIDLTDYTQVDTLYDNSTTYEYTPNLEGPYIYPLVGLPLGVRVLRSPRLFDRDAIPENDEERGLLTMNDWAEARPGGAPFSIVVEQKERDVLEYDHLASVELGEEPLLGEPFRRTETTYHWDNFGNLRDETSATTGTDPLDPDEDVGSELTVSSFTYDNLTDDGVWLVGLRRTARVMNRVGDSNGTVCHEPDDSCETRRSSFDYYPNGLLLHATVEPDEDGFEVDPDAQIETTLVRNPQGLVERVEARGTSGGLRVTTIGYDADLVFPHRLENAMGHVSWVETQPGFGAPAVTSDANDNVTSFTYDGFGRTRSAAPEVGVGFEKSYQSPEAGSRFNVSLVVETRGADGSRSLQSYDTQGRPSTTSVLGFNADEWIDSGVSFDELGRLSGRTLPHVRGGPAGAELFHYNWIDGVERVLRTEECCSSTSFVVIQDVTYPSPFESIAADAENKTNQVRLDISGRVVRSSSGDTAPSVFGYGPFSTLRSVTRRAGDDRVVRRFEYDVLGRPRAVRDPDAGDRENFFNSFGDLRETIDPAGDHTINHFDALGRTVLIEERGNRDTSFVWDREVFGGLSETHSPDGVSTFLDYDELARLEAKTLQIGDERYSATVDYDGFSRVERMRYPNPDPDQDRLRVRYFYARGQLANVLGERTGQSPVGYWHLDSANPTYAKEIAGNGTTTERFFDGALRPRRALITNAQGSTLSDTGYDYYLNDDIRRRTDSATDIVDEYSYDSVGRIENWTRGDHEERYEYDDLGRMRHARRRSSPSQSFADTGYSYEQTNGAGPQAPTAVGDFEYGYDAFGRRETKSRNGEVLETIEYTSFDLPKRFAGPSGDTAELSYGALGQRTRKTSSAGTTTYMDELFERRVENVGAATDVFHIYAGGRHVLDVTWNEDDDRESTEYLQEDVQGSVILTEGADSEPTRLHYAPFGERINAAGDPFDDVDGPPQHFGYTGHEHDDDLGLINMRGRIYDPFARKFLTPDPVVSGAFDGQSHNPYSYVRNNPIRFTDPSGYCVLGWDIFGPCNPDPKIDRGVPTAAPTGGMAARQPAPPTAAATAVAPPASRAAPAQNATPNEQKKVSAGASAVGREEPPKTGKDSNASSQQQTSEDTVFSGDPTANALANTPLSRYSLLLPVPGFAGNPFSPMNIAAANRNLIGGMLGDSPLGGSPGERVPSLDETQKIVQSAFTAVNALGALRGVQIVLRLPGPAVAAEAPAVERAIVPFYPPNNGFLGPTTQTVLKQGQVIDRVAGGADARFFSPAGTPLAARALPPGTGGPLRAFEVVNPFSVESGTVAPAYGQLGMGTQFRSEMTLGELVKQGFVREIP